MKMPEQYLLKVVIWVSFISLAKKYKLSYQTYWNGYSSFKTYKNSLVMKLGALLILQLSFQNWWLGTLEEQYEIHMFIT